MQRQYRRCSPKIYPKRVLYCRKKSCSLSIREICSGSYYHNDKCQVEVLDTVTKATNKICYSQILWVQKISCATLSYSTTMVSTTKKNRIIHVIPNNSHILCGSNLLLYQIQKIIKNIYSFVYLQCVQGSTFRTRIKLNI